MGMKGSRDAKRDEGKGAERMVREVRGRNGGERESGKEGEREGRRGERMGREERGQRLRLEEVGRVLSHTHTHVPCT